MRFHLLQAALALVAVACAGCGSQSGVASRERPNIVCVVIDTLRADHLGLYGYQRPTSPALDELGRRALVVDRMIAQSSWTKPSVASLFTSLNPSQHRAVEETTQNVLAGSLTTLAEILQQEGYRTAGFSENPHIGPSTRFDQGFDLFQTLGGFDGNKDFVVQGARAFLEQATNQRDPFFLYLHILDPHGPYEPGPERRSEFLGDLESSDARVRQGRVGQLAEGTQLLAQLTPQDLDYLRALYDAELRQTDQVVAELLTRLEQLGLRERTIVLVTSDHGEEFLEHGTLKHGYQLFEETVRVPLILAVPGAPARRVGDAALQHIDLAPTLLELVGLPVPGTFRGQSFAGLLRGESLPERPMVLETAWRGVDIKALRRGRWKLIVDRVAGTRRLFDLETDPAELHDRSASEPGLVDELEAELTRATAPLSGLQPDDASGAGDPQAERALRALGYFGK